jgi:acyl-CoA synthetase (AMP-forming)/AMP-acid ligase II
MDEEGYITLRGRASDVIIRGGSNVYPDEIESVLAGHEHVRECAVVGVESPRLGEEIVAFIVAEEALAEHEIQAFGVRNLTAGKRPARYCFVSSLPMNANGKVLRRALRQQGSALLQAS